MIQRILYKGMFLLLTGTAACVHAQSYKNAATVDSVPSSGFYAIAITPKLTSLLSTDLRDLRITDAHGNFVPYLMMGETSVTDSALLKSLKIISNDLNDSGQSILTFRNLQRDKLDAIYIRIRNAAVSRMMNLSGSNDGKKWYSIVENLSLPVHSSQHDDSFLQEVSFPLSSYPYFQLKILNGRNDPLDILSIQEQKTMGSIQKPAVVMNPPVSFKRMDSNQITTLIVGNQLAYHITNLFIKIKKPRFFKRQLDVIAGGFLVGSFVVNSDSLVNLNLPVFNDSVFSLRIYNEDNLPLEITQVSTGQYANTIVAYLEKGQLYRLQMTNSQAFPPRYDLLNFKDSIPKLLTTIRISKIFPASAAVPIAEKKSTRNWLWPTLILSLILLGLFTYRLTRDMVKKH